MRGFVDFRDLDTSCVSRSGVYVGRERGDGGGRMRKEEEGGREEGGGRAAGGVDVGDVMRGKVSYRRLFLRLVCMCLCLSDCHVCVCVSSRVRVFSLVPAAACLQRREIDATPV